MSFIQNKSLCIYFINKKLEISNLHIHTLGYIDHLLKLKDPFATLFTNVPQSFNKHPRLLDNAQHAYIVGILLLGTASGSSSIIVHISASIYLILVHSSRISNAHLRIASFKN